MSNEYPPPGTHVRVTFDGVVTSPRDYTERVNRIRIKGEDGIFHVFDPRKITIERIEPEVKTGDVWETATGSLWFARERDLGIRMTPATHAGVLIVPQFFEQYPDAKRVFEGR